MDILQTPVRFYPAVGGVESYVYELGRRLCARGHRLTVLCAATGAGQTPDTVDGMEVRRLFSPASIANTNITPTLPVHLLQYARQADVIHTHLPTPWSADLSVLAGAVTGTPVVVTYHNDIVGEGMFAPVAALYNATALRVTLRLADRILLTREGYADAADHLTSRHHETTVVPNGVDVDRFQPRCDNERVRQLGFAPDRQNLFFVSVLDAYHEYKGVDVLLAAMETLIESRAVPPQLVIGGDGPRRDHYETLVRERGLDGYVTFAGYIDDDVLPAAYTAADAFVLPSTDASQEGFGLVALEALACETPVVTTDVVGVADEIRTRDLGAVVPSGNPQALATGIRTVLEGSPNVAAGRELCVTEYAWSESVTELLAVYEAVCEDSS